MKEKQQESYQVTDGEWLDVGTYKQHECCDCGLVHRIRYRIHEGKSQESWTRNDRATAKARPWAGFS